ncbi:MAG: DUF1801 domain-containing protein [Flavobacterium sp.]|jgi:hypothetical protein|uniref:DUF1801 domain-containing protein n=1 Tax=Flavobacterium sp. TaxID=239 RepID=UPI0022C7C736|nr:DUF1801 domain-containing protein [Flavobacterium sp.]MCZ8168190.1 DUF1801 domain-containing protein [Flavobacterium sp.]MCZ8297255.1 DUF1801 domain-containing protein [Flavobacterium sp.]
MVHNSIIAYNLQQESGFSMICEQLSTIIQSQLSGAESKLWHAHPVWFMEGNPIVGYSKQKRGIRLMFWSGQDFDEPNLNVQGKNVRMLQFFYTDVSQIDAVALERWLQKAQMIQWDYKNLVKRKGVLVRLK